MKTVIVCISDPYLVRGKQLRDYYRSQNDEVTILTPDYSHSAKKKMTEADPDVQMVHHLPYKKNLSLKRMAGHFLFAKECLKVIEKIRPDRIHCMLPANSLGPQISRYKKKHPETELIFDVVDLWPESFPVPVKIPGFGIWKNMRQKSLPEADRVFIECDYYRKYLPAEVQSAEVLYWAGENHHPDLKAVWNPEEIDLAYLGSMNNILDIELVSEFLKALAENRTVRLHLIGAGEKKPLLLEALSHTAVDVKDHGVIYDPAVKQQIFNCCRFGLNLMKENVLVGLSMKSIDYFQSGLPVINSLAGDTWSFIEQNQAGINLDRQNLQSSAQIVLNQTSEENLDMRKHSRGLFLQNFSSESFFRQLSHVQHQKTESSSSPSAVQPLQAEPRKADNHDKF